MKSEHKLLVLLLFFCIAPSFLNGQDRNFTHFTLRSGIPSGYVSQMIEDRYGYIWIGTTGGLSKFDGYNFVNYTQKVKDSTSLKGSYISTIIDYDSSTLIVATADALNIYNRATNVFKIVLVTDSIPTLSEISDVVAMPNGDLWVLSRHGLYFITADEIMSEVSEITYYDFPQPGDNGSARVGSILYDGGQTLWLGSDYQPLQKFDLEKKEFVPLGSFSKDIEEFMEEAIWDILFDASGDLYVVGDKGLLGWKSGIKSPELINPAGNIMKEKYRFFQSINLDSEGRLLVGTGESGAFRWDPITDEIDAFVNDAAEINTVNSNDVHYVFEDSNQNLWFGYHFLGLSMMYFNSLDYTFKNFGEELNMTFGLGDLFNVSEDEEGNLWFPAKQGLIRQSKEDGTLKIFKPSETAILGASVSYKDKLYISGKDDKFNHIYSFDIKKKSFNKIFSEEKNFIIPILNESESHIYFPTMGARVISVNKETEEVNVIEPPISEIGGKGPSTLATIQPDMEGNLIAEVYYLNDDARIETFVFDPGNNSYQEIDVERKFPATNRTPDQMSSTEPMTLWSRNQFGLAKVNLSTKETVTYFEGEPLIQENPTGSFVEDNEGYIWMNNATGIMRLDPATQSISQYQIRKEYKPEAFLKPFLLKNGDIIFTAANGYIRFNPAQAQVQLSVDNLHLTELRVDDKTYNLLFQKIPESLSYDDNDISISYLGFNYLDPTGTNYRYRVKGFNEDWTYVEGQRRVFLANLPAGKFEFEVQAATKYGSYETGRSLELNIQPPWWLTWYAYVLYALMVMLFFFMLYRLQKARTFRVMRERNRDLDLARAKEIEKAYNQLQNTQKQLIHAEKMASLGELTAGIAHEIQNPLNFVNNFADINRELLLEQQEEILNKNYEEVAAIAEDLRANEEKIIHHGKRAEEIVKSMLQHSRTGSGEKELTDINALADEYLRLSYHGLRAKDKSFNADFKLNLDDSIPKIEAIPQDLGRVLLNLINNAFFATNEKARSAEKGYSPTVELSTKKNGNQIVIVIQDNGSGVPDGIKEKIFQPFFTTKAAGTGTGLGLSLSYDIITKGHGGTISVESEEGKGTKFIIQLPIK